MLRVNLEFVSTFAVLSGLICLFGDTAEGPLFMPSALLVSASLVLTHSLRASHLSPRIATLVHIQDSL